jgi:hypothetical protein
MLTEHERKAIRFVLDYFTIPLLGGLPSWLIATDLTLFRNIFRSQWQIHDLEDQLIYTSGSLVEAAAMLVHLETPDNIISHFGGL